MANEASTTKLNPYLSLPGTAEDAIELYRKVFKVDPVFLQRYKEMPSDGYMTMSPGGGERILHAVLPVGSDRLMLSDAPEGQDHTVAMGSQMHICIETESKEEADRMFGLLTDDGRVVMPMAVQCVISP